MAADGEPDGRIESDVVVIGGGLVGLTLGVALAGAGIETVVVDGAAPEAMRDAAFDGRVSSIALGSKCVLDGIGLWPALAGDAEPILDIRVSDGDAPLFLHYDHKAAGAGPLGFIVENRAIRAALGARGGAAGAPPSRAGLGRGAGACRRRDPGQARGRQVSACAPCRRRRRRQFQATRPMSYTISSSFVIGFSLIGCTVASTIGSEQLGVANGAVKSDRLLAERNGDQFAADIADLHAGYSAWGERGRTSGEATVPRRRASGSQSGRQSSERARGAGRRSSRWRSLRSHRWAGRD